MKRIRSGILLFLFNFICVFMVSCETEDIHKMVSQYEWTDLYVHKYFYEESCKWIFAYLPLKLYFNEFSTSLLKKERPEEFLSWDLAGMVLEESFIPAYGGRYMDGIKMQHRDSYEECYAVTLEVLKTLHKEYIEMGIIQRKQK